MRFNKLLLLTFTFCIGAFGQASTTVMAAITATRVANALKSADSGSANAYVGSDPFTTAPFDGMLVMLTPANTVSGGSSSGGGGTPNPPFLMTISGTNYVLPFMTAATPFSTSGFSNKAGSPTISTVGSVPILTSDGTTTYNLYGTSIGTNTTIIAALNCNVVSTAGFPDCAIYISEAASGNMYWIGPSLDAATSTANLDVIKGTAAGAFTIALEGPSMPGYSGPIFLKITVGTNCTVSYSVDGGESYNQLLSEAETSLFTAAPDTMGITVSGAGPATAEVLSWSAH
jgi:hypothetical protein